MKGIYRIETRGARSGNTIALGNLRVTVIAPALIRLEWSEKGIFTDKATQKIWNRDLGAVEFIRKDYDDECEIGTSRLTIRCRKVGDGGNVSLRSAVEVIIKNPVGTRTWRHGDKTETLKGTARTLDNADGAIPLGEGIISRSGIAILDDSRSCLINDDGTISAREDKNCTDVYLFAYGHDYKDALRDFLLITGRPPLLPRWALGNWWSRYHRYTQEEYLALMDEFARRKIPLSVAMIDMDWHITKIDSSIGTGWTGYTWNRELFPDPKQFLSELHKRNLTVSLNIHPAEGVGRHEEDYEAMRKSLKRADDGETIPFDMTSPDFVEAYFSCLHHPKEKDGVDFWWIDWQQGEKTKLADLDPLWLLNHYHFLDNKKSGKDALILSRYSGEGSHRYPVGFSGDTVISWKSLDFQPFFTATASNIGYCWWSHDIGGHMLGTYDEELQVRWVQLGVFSPIMRLHSSSSEFNHKEPWLFGAGESAAITGFLRMRHALIPYLNTMNVRFSRDLVPPIRPLYHEFPEENEAYDFPNEYFFGTELIACPITSPAKKDLRMAPVRAWIPEGSYTDIFTGMTYEGKKTVVMYRPLESFPLLLKAGGILPLESEVFVSLGAEGKFVQEDCGTGEGSDFYRTEFGISGEGVFFIRAPKGKSEEYDIHFLNCDEVLSAESEICGQKRPSDFRYDPLMRKASVRVSVPASGEAAIRLSTRKNEELGRKMVLSRCFSLLDKAEIDFVRKERLFSAVKKGVDTASVCGEILAEETDCDFVSALFERICSR